MCATAFEFKYRDILIRLIYLVAFLCYVFDPPMTGSLLGEWLSSKFGVFPETTWKHAVLFVGAALVVLAVSIRTWATAYLRYDVMRNPQIHTERLIADGPFGYLRNPLYFGNLLMVAGVTFSLSRTGMAVLVFGTLVVVQRLVRREEMELARTHSESFHQYCREVPRWVPSLEPRAAAAGYTPSFREGVMGELFLWIIALALTVYAATFDIKLFGIVFVCAFIPGASRRIHRIRQRRSA
ncbi:MAG TPA: methyltransferase [Terriglobia bacterium]|nr:methyltransferase [Terriglobia bacterium]